MRTCGIAGCDMPPRSKRARWCETHYYRWRRHGDPLTVHPKSQRKRPCQFSGCPRNAHSLGWCKSHYDKAHRHGDPLGRTDIGYTAAHDRVRRERGDARAHDCQRCGVAARQWAYTHSDPDARVEQGMAYSANPVFYEPLCVPCHKRADLARIALKAKRRGFLA